MEAYINNKTLVDNQVNNALKSSVICPLCENILINPIMCMSCQNVYCKKCIDNSINKDKKCSCDNPNYQKCIGRNSLLSQLKFICVGCFKEIGYDEAQKHHDSCCPDKTSENMKKKTPYVSKIKKLTPEEVALYKKEGNETISRITSKKKI